MELWIRTQDRECLMKVDRLDYDWYKNEHNIVANGFKTVLATYDTQERALEVLDEMQNILAPKYMIRMDENLNNITNFLNIDGAYIKNDNNADVKNINNTFVYEMPQE